MVCSRCGFAASQNSRFCPSCGLQIAFATQPEYLAPERGIPQAAAYSHALARHGGFGQMFGLHPGIAFLTLVVDAMLFGGDVATMGALLPVSIGVGALLGVITYKAQMRWYGDDKESAAIKGLILGFLTAIPAPLPAIFSVPSGILGLIHSWRNKLK